jgi:demethylmenaquinone methyltransferase/2-methoxy-6-polyprenyl-1,4-benzoquinol methylase
MDINSVINFFDKQAATWDAEMIKDDNIIGKILDNAQISENTTVLDVACGTGVMIPYYIDKKVKSVTGIDISRNMIDIAEEKFSALENVSFICDSAISYSFNNKFDRIVVYNAFPHFENPETLISKLSSLLNEGGVLTVAHGMSKEQIDKIHRKGANSVSIPLMSSDELSKLFGKYLTVTVNISDSKMYQVCGKK